MLDTHAHIDDPQYQDNLESFIAQQQAEGVEAILVPGVDVTTIQPVLDVCQRFPNYLFPARMSRLTTKTNSKIFIIH